MARTIVLALLLCAILTLLAEPVQRWLKRVAHQSIFIGPLALSAVFWLVLWTIGIRSPIPVLLILAYTLAPTVLARIPWADFVIILLLWLPLEFAVGANLIPKPLQGFVHSVAYGVAILLALWIFLIVRELPGMKYNLPRGARDFLTPLAGYAAVAPILIVLGLWLSFIQPFHIPPRLSAGFVLTRFLLILIATALPEEILFRSLLQNAIMQKLGFTNWALLLASVIFGLAHLNNGGGPQLNWRYAIMASIAGFAYGKVFQKSSSVFSSAILHALINTSRHIFF